MASDPRAIVWQHLYWPHPLDAHLALGLLQRLAADTLRDPVVFEARAFMGQVVYHVGTAAHQVRAITDLLDTSVPTLAHSSFDPEVQQTTDSYRVKLSPAGIPLVSAAPASSARSLLGALSAAHFRDEHALLQVVLGRGKRATLMPPHAFDPTQSWFEVILRGSRVASADLMTRMRTKQAELGFMATVRISASAATETRRLTILRGIAAAVRTHQAPGLRIDFLADRNSALPKRLPLRLSVTEALSLMAWPVDSADLPGLPSPHPKQVTPARLANKADRVFAHTTAPGDQRDVGIAASDSLFHTLLLGPTGSGKSTALLNLICADMEAGRSVVVIDPKSDLVRDVLARIPAFRSDDVVVLDPTSQTPVGLNPLRSDGTSPELIADGLLTVFRDLFQTSLGPNVMDALHASLLTLAYSPGATLADLPTLLTDARYRAAVLAKITDRSALESFWAHFDAMSPGQQQNFIGPVLTRLRQFLLRPNLRRVLDQPEPRFQLSEVMTKPKILLVPLNAGILGKESARLLGSLLVTQLWQLSLARAAQPASGRAHVSIYIDEVQEYLRLGGSDLADALARSRSLGVAWHLAHQFRDQLDPATRRAVDANARNVITFTLKHDDARDLAHTAPDLAPEDFMALPQFGVYARLMVDGSSSGWFSAATNPAPLPTSDPATLRAASDARYGRHDTPARAPRLDHLHTSPAADEDDTAGVSTSPQSTIGRRKRSTS